ncbi:hypothetical protein [Levilactobacillus spicheri]|uniref:Uncharacterized protein n=2 Tax=Levilactobacillus spicheri TaxID=216463 RepID=A0ABQ0WQE3_9LACO|nr:hypothetical protein [Levilactobacillus spicheri]KRL50445.1 hypothetical protein FD37_GL002111 [Levilactobacillus spicheri DSM 15429]GEO67322.1 hypothetical protein LSP04_17410 [Levilactobacillus spicheri]
MIKDEELLSVDRKYLNHRGRKAAGLAKITKDYADSMNRVPATDEGAVTLLDGTIDALTRLKDVLSEEVQENDSRSATQNMSFEDAITSVLLHGKKIRRRDWFDKLLFRNPGDFVDGAYNHPAAMAMKINFQQDLAEPMIQDAASLLSKDDRNAHDWETVDCKLPWEE